MLPYQMTSDFKGRAVNAATSVLNAQKQPFEKNMMQYISNMLCIHLRSIILNTVQDLPCYEHII